MKIINCIFLMLLLLLLNGCGAGDGSLLNENGQPIVDQPPVTEQQPPVVDEQPPVNEGTPPTEPLPPGDENKAATLTALQENIFTPICSVCHVGANAPFGLQFDTLDNTAKNLINVTAVGNSEFLRVTPGNKEASFIYLKVLGDPRAGSRMPLNQPGLSNADIAAIGEWIDKGALIAENSAPLFITQFSQQQSNDSVDISISFSVDVDKSTLPAEQILLMEDDRALSIPYQLIWQNNRLLTIRIGKQAQISSLTLVLNQDSIGTVMGTFGQQLDGNSDGQPGGALTYAANF